jgi:hypothetical protein
MNRANADPAKNPKLTVAYGFEYQLDSDNDARDPNGNCYDCTDFALREQGLTPLQVQIVWPFIPASPSWDAEDDSLREHAQLSQGCGSSPVVSG